MKIKNGSELLTVAQMKFYRVPVWIRHTTFSMRGWGNVKFREQSLLQLKITYLRHRSASSWSIWNAAGTIRNLNIIVSSLFHIYTIISFLIRKQSRLLELYWSNHESSEHCKFRIPNSRKLICLRIWKTSQLFWGFRAGNFRMDNF